MMKVYGVPGWGSAISEVMLTLAEIPYTLLMWTALTVTALRGSYLKK